MPVIKNNIDGSLILHLNSGRMVFLEPLSKLELKGEDMSSPMLVQFINEGKIALLEEQPSSLNSTGLTIRKGKATKPDGLVYAQHLKELNPGFNRLYGEEAEDVIATAYAQPGHILSFEHVEFAVQNDEIIGSLACYTQEHHDTSVAGGLKHALRSYSAYRFGTTFLVRNLRRFGPETPNDYYVWLLYVQESPSAQNGRGLSLGKIYNREGVLVASVAQEGMVRIPELA